jgi:hypothetical protein
MKHKSGIELIAQERATHERRGYDKNHDKSHYNGDMADMAAVYACTHRNSDLNGEVTIREAIWGTYPSFPYAESDRSFTDWFTDQPNRIAELVKAGALIAAEIDRLQNLEK